ncbi:MAG: PepSY-like domain-containing protein [Bacteroidales bacterium]|nr:PepSY-like domain-containing protein [Bacteroidales bacterium]
MKKTLLIAIGVILLTGSICAQERHSIKRDQLPSAAMKYIQNNWNNVSPSKIIKITQGFDVAYEVTLVDGTLINFNRDGSWKDISADKEVTKSAVPAGIRRYVLENCPKYKIVRMDKETEGYKIHLSNGLEMRFDFQGNRI